MHLPGVPQEALDEFSLDRKGYAAEVLSELQGTGYASF